jgi:selenocysteine lyase/cysteine desulfurase
VEPIQQYCGEITKEATSTLQNAGFLVEDEKYRGTHLFGIRVTSKNDLDAIKEKLDKEKILVSFRGNCIRVAPNVYNTPDDLTHLTQILCS